MKITAEVCRIVDGKILALATDPAVTTATRLEKGVWREKVMRAMRREERHADLVVQGGAKEDWYRDRIEYVIRHSRVPAVDNLRELEVSLRRAEEANEIVQIRQGNGEYLAKRYIDMSPLEADVLAEQYERQSATLARKAAQLRQDARQARLAGLPDDKPFSTLLAA